MKKSAGTLLIGLLLAGVLLPASAQTQGIYSCVDAKGRKLTADRPIAECIDREQKLHNPSGTVKATVGPTLTAQERIEHEEQLKREAEEREIQAENKRRERALVARYPNKAMHDSERAEALSQIGVVRNAAVNRVNELLVQRERLDKEREFYKKSPDKEPSSLRRQIEENAHSMEVQGRFIAEQDAEIGRVNARFDEELAQLRKLWAQRTPAAAASK
jgi:hypothetical protein